MLERLSPTKPGRDQDALLQAAWAERVMAVRRAAWAGGTFRLTFDRQVAELQIGAIAGSLEPMAFTRSP